MNNSNFKEQQALMHAMVAPMPS